MNKKLFFLSLLFTFHLLPMDYMSGLFSSTVAMAKQCINSNTFKTMVVAGASAIVANACFVKVSSWFKQKNQKPRPDKGKEKIPDYLTRADAKNFITMDQARVMFLAKSEANRRFLTSDVLDGKLKPFITRRKAAGEFLTLRSFMTVLEDFAKKSDLPTAEDFEVIRKTILRIITEEKIDPALKLLKKEIKDRQELAEIVGKFNQNYQTLLKNIKEKYDVAQGRLITLETILLGFEEVVQHPDFKELYKKASPRNGKAKFNLPIPVGLVEHGNGSDSYPGSPSSMHDSYQGSFDDEETTELTFANSPPTVRKRILSNSH